MNKNKVSNDYNTTGIYTLYKDLLDSYKEHIEHFQIMESKIQKQEFIIQFTNYGLEILFRFRLGEEPITFVEKLELQLGKIYANPDKIVLAFLLMLGSFTNEQD